MTLIDNRRARLVAYAPWIARDYLTNQGPATMIVVLLIAFLTLKGYSGATGIELSNLSANDARRMLRSLTGIAAFFGAFFATNGIVANDRKHGTYKFLFAKPVSPPHYYAWTFLMHGVGLLIVVLALLGLWALTVRPMFPVELLPVIALMYIGYGGLAFLLSAAWRFDWVSLVTVLLVANVSWTFWMNATGPLRALLYLLPPVHRIDNVYTVVMRQAHEPIPWQIIAWFGGYGLICFALGLIVIRRRPLGTS
jgi:ABC-type transport system involved in multi-copper enzyme maturation permease subunit